MTATSTQRPNNDSTPLDPRQCFRGTPASTGRAVGRAHVVWTPEEAAIVEGTILVVRSLSPGFAAAFASAAGVIAERGGPLSNSATLVREAGIPAVVLEGAIALLHTGDLVTLDGASGSIEVDDRR